MSKVNRVALDKHLRNSFDDVGTDKKAFILLLNGKRVSVSSGKKLWGSKGAAKNAINNHMGYVYSYAEIYHGGVRPSGHDGYDAKLEAEQAVKEWVENNIQIVSVGEYEAAQNKLKTK